MTVGKLLGHRSATTTQRYLHPQMKNLAGNERSHSIASEKCSLPKLRGSHFCSPVHIDRNVLTVPMKLFRNVRVVVILNSGLFTFPESQERAGKLAIEGCRGNETVLPNFDQAVLNAQLSCTRGTISQVGIEYRYRLSYDALAIDKGASRVQLSNLDDSPVGKIQKMRRLS